MLMEETIYLHIGVHKTGTSAIQLFLSINRELLKQNGYLYPGQKSACYDFSLELNTKTFLEIISDANSPSKKYLKEIQQTTCKNIIFSSEGFIKLKKNEVVTLQKILPEKYKIKIIIYLRRQDNKLESLYNQFVKSAKRRYQQKFTDSIPELLETGFFDYYSVLLPWSQVFGKENIIVRCYEKEQLANGIYHDFLRVVGLPADKNYRFPKEKVNQSLNWDLIEIVRICNIHFKEDIRFHHFLINSLEQVNLGMRDEKRHLLSPQHRRDIIAQYEESNAKVAREYLGRTDGRLFYAPLPDLDEPWTPYEGLTVEKIVPVLTQMMFNLEREQQRRRNALENRSLKRMILNRMKRIGSKLGLLQ
jgi:hypothetical protein